MTYSYSASIVIPAASQSDGNAFAEALGWGPNNFSVPLSANGQEPATHYGCHTRANQTFVDMVGSAQQGEFPPVPNAATIFPLLSIKIEQAEGAPSWQALLAELGLQRIVQGELL